jgi:hypothetical protein
VKSATAFRPVANDFRPGSVRGGKGLTFIIKVWGVATVLLLIKKGVGGGKGLTFYRVSGVANALLFIKKRCQG